MIPSAPASISEGAWLAIASLCPSLAMVVAVVRSSRVSHFKDRIELLEDELKECRRHHRACRRDLNALRRWAMWAQNNYTMRPTSRDQPPPLPELAEEADEDEED